MTQGGPRWIELKIARSLTQSTQRSAKGGKTGAVAVVVVADAAALLLRLRTLGQPLPDQVLWLERGVGAVKLLSGKGGGRVTETGTAELVG